MERIIIYYKDGTNVASNFLEVCVRIKFLVCNILLGLEKSKIVCALRSRWIINVTVSCLQLTMIMLFKMLSLRVKHPKVSTFSKF